MVNDRYPAPLHYKGVMVSSTFTDLEQHRAALIKALSGQKLMPVVMENDSAKPDVDLIDSSLHMVQDGSAYIGVISRKYGQTPKCTQRNPDKVSITELEFNEAQRLNRPILLFIMGEGHPVREADVEINATKRKKLKAFRQRAKQMKPDSPVHRVYACFDSFDEFKEKAIHAVASLRRYLDEQDKSSTPHPQAASPAPVPDKAESDLIPTPPAFYAEPPYIGSHDFVGRKAQLDVLSDWASPADSHTILLFEAIGGAGKSLLTWEWTTKHATFVRQDWAGVFWYSFYEKGAIMADFCRHALAYMTGKPLEDFRKKKTPELGEQLLHQLQASPWLVIFDGLERVLVAYHRFDAAQLTDEQAGAATDQIAHRDPCAAIRPEDDDLLRALTAVAPSKLLLTSRLIPRVLLNPASQPIPGVLCERLPGLRPADAEALLRACGITGTSKDIQDYLKTHCDCHPLVTGVLAGLINDYLPDRGNFDAWAVDPAGGGKLNLAELDLVQKRNHILHAALVALPEKSRQLLSTLALLSEAVDYPTLSAFNPHLLPEPDEVKEPRNPESQPWWEKISDEKKKQARQHYQAALHRRKEYEQAVKARLQSKEFLDAPQELATTIRDLEQRGLLQYDAQAQRYDLHPVVRGIAAGRLRQEEKERYGQLVVDHFSLQAHCPYEQAETLEDVRDCLQIVRILLQMGRHRQAFDAYRGDFARALYFNLEAHAEILSLLRPFFPQGWATIPDDLGPYGGTNLATYAGIALQETGDAKEALAAFGATLLANLRQANWRNVRVSLFNISRVFYSENRLAKEEFCLLLALDLAALLDDEETLFKARLDRFRQLADIGQWQDAEAMWQLLDSFERNLSTNIYRPDTSEYIYVHFRLFRGDMTEDHLTHAEESARAANVRPLVRWLHGLRGQWHLEQGQHALAAESLHEAVRMARQVGKTDTGADTLLALAKFHLNELPNPRDEAERLAKSKDPDHRTLAELWLAIGDREQAKKHALTAYKWAWADGEPYVHRYELNKTRSLLEQLCAEIPDLPPYDPVKVEKLPWEDEVAAAIEKFRAEKEAKKATEKSEEEQKS